MKSEGIVMICMRTCILYVLVPLGEVAREYPKMCEHNITVSNNGVQQTSEMMNP